MTHPKSTPTLIEQMRHLEEIHFGASLVYTDLTVCKPIPSIVAFNEKSLENLHIAVREIRDGLEYRLSNTVVSLIEATHDGKPVIVSGKEHTCYSRAALFVLEQLLSVFNGESEISDKIDRAIETIESIEDPKYFHGLWTEISDARQALIEPIETQVRTLANMFGSTGDPASENTPATATPKLMTSSEMLDMLERLKGVPRDVGTQRMCDARKKGALTYRQSGNNYLYPTEDAEQWIKDQRPPRKYTRYDDIG